MKKAISLCMIFSIILSLVSIQPKAVSAATAYEVTRQLDMESTWTKVADSVSSDVGKWTFVSGDANSPGWATYIDYNTPLSVEGSSHGVYSSSGSLSGNPRGRVGIYHKSVQKDTGGRVLQFTGGSYINFAVTFDIQAVNMWNTESTRKADFDFGLIENSLPVEDLQTGYEGKNYIRLGSSVDMQTLTIPSGIAGEEISPRATVINTKTAEDYPNAEVVTQTDSITGAEYIESVTENDNTTYWNQVINCKIVVNGDVMSIYMKFEDAEEWKHIKSYDVAALQDKNKRFYVVCSGFQMLVSNFDIWSETNGVSDDLEYIEGTVLYDDFETDDLFWDTTEADDPMRIVDGVLVSDNGRTKCSASTKGRLWDNFYADINFSFLTNTSGDFSDGYVKFSIRADDDKNAMTLVINTEKISVYYNGVAAGSILYKFNRNERYDLKIKAQSESVSLYVKPQSDSEYTFLQNYTYEREKAGKIKIETYHERVGIYDVKISDLNNQDFYFSDSFVKIKQGSTQKIEPTNNTDKEVKNITYSSSDAECVSVKASTGEISSVGKSGICTITALITASDDSVYTACYDVAVVVPLKNFTFSKKHITLRVGETLNARITPIPADVSNKQFIWTTDSPECIEFVGDTELSRGIRALSPKTGITVTVISAEEIEPISGMVMNMRDSFTIDVIEQDNTLVNQTFNLSAEAVREIPEYFWGISTAVGENRNEYLPYLKQIKPMSIRTCTTDLKVEDMFHITDQMGIPLFFATSLDYTVEESIEVIRIAKEHADDKTIFVEIMNEPYDLGAAEKVPTVQDYMNKVKEIYQAIKPQYGDGVKIGVSLLPYKYDAGARLAYESSGGTSSVRYGVWNTYIRDNPDYYDAVILHSYSTSSMNMTTTNDLMESFSESCALEEMALNLYKEEFKGKDFWVTEYGDLPGFLLDNPNTSLKSRLQYMKSVGNAAGYVQKLLTLLQNEEVTMAAHHAFADTQGFGIMGSNYGILPNFYVYKKMGEIFEKYSHLYSLETEMLESDDFQYQKDWSYGGADAQLNIQRLNGWAFGDEEAVKEAIFVNTSSSPVNVSIPSKFLNKKWQYGATSYKGNNPLPDFAVNSLYWTESPESIPVPEEYEEGYFDTIEVPPYSIVVADIGEKGFQLRYSDVSYSFEGENCEVYYNIRTSTYSGDAHLFTAMYENERLVDVKRTEINVKKDEENEFYIDVPAKENISEIRTFIFRPDWSLCPLSYKYIK